MRIFSNTYELMSEISRDLWEMGIEVKPSSMQNKVVKGNPSYITKEIQNYHYRLVSLEDIEPLLVFSSPYSEKWVKEEFKERIMPQSEFSNPGKAWLLRAEEWGPLLNSEGKMDYTYNERLQGLSMIIQELKRNPDSRQAWLPIFERKDLSRLGGKKRIPCSLGYSFQVRNGLLSLTYIQRSADFVSHFGNDILLAAKMMQYVAKQLGVGVSHMEHFIFSLHSYQKDWSKLEKGISKLVMNK